VLSAVLAEPGQSVAPASALANLVPQGAVLQAQLYAPSSAVGFVRPGQTVRLRLEAFPYQKFGQLEGRVVQVSRTPLAASELAAQTLAGVAPGRPGEAMFRITVGLVDGQAGRWPQPLVAGMRLQAGVRAPAVDQASNRCWPAATPVTTAAPLRTWACGRPRCCRPRPPNAAWPAWPWWRRPMGC
jgi:hypothetical protein